MLGNSKISNIYLQFELRTIYLQRSNEIISYINTHYATCHRSKFSMHLYKMQT